MSTSSRVRLVAAFLLLALPGLSAPAARAQEGGEYGNVIVDEVTKLQQLNLVRARCVGQVDFGDAVLQASNEWARRGPAGARGGFSSKEWQDLIDAEKAIDRGKASSVRCQEATGSFEERIVRFLKDSGALEREAERRRIDRIRTTREIDQTLRTLAGTMAGVGRALLADDLGSVTAALGLAERRLGDFRVALAPLIESGEQQATWESLLQVQDALREGLRLARQERWAASYAAWLESDLAMAKRRKVSLDDAGFQNRMTAAGGAMRTQQEFNVAVAHIDHEEAKRAVTQYRPRVEQIVADMDRVAGGR